MPRVFIATRRGAQPGFDDIECEVIQGKRANAILDAVGSNATHGVRRTNADKRHAVLMLLNNKTWAKRTDRWIADACAVSPTTVGNIRAELSKLDTGQNGEASNLPKTTPDGRVHLPARKAQVKDATARVECPNCGHDEVTDDGDCAKCYEPDLVDVEEDFDGFDEFDPSVGIVNLLRDVRNLRNEWPVDKYRVMANVLRDLADETEAMHDDDDNA